MATVSMTVNGKAVTADIDPRTLLVQFLRDHLRLTGSHVGCDTSQCGACVVHLNGRAVKSCTMLALQADGGHVLTIEGLAVGGELHPMQQAFREHHGLQCGFCTPGMIMSAIDIVHRRGTDLDEATIRDELKGNLCRCTGYHNIVKAIERRRPRHGGRAAAARGGSERAATSRLTKPDSPREVAMTVTRIGDAVKRKEDHRFLTGKGQYTDDINRPGQTYAYFLRSPHAHANVRSINADAARALPGVIAVFTGADLAADNVGALPCGWMIHSKDGSPMKAPGHPCLAQGKVRYVGDPVAAVIAETLTDAKDAAAAIEVEYEVLPAVVTAAEAQAPGAPLVFDEVPRNTAFEWAIGNKDDTERAFAAAAHVTKLDIVNNRLVPNAMEPRAALAEWDSGNDAFTLWTTSQNPHVARLVLSAFVGIAPEHRLRVIAPDVGGGFGSKIYVYPEETVAVWASKKIGRPVKWTCDRMEAFQADAHGRDHITHAELACDERGRILGLRVKTLANVGGYLSLFASSVPTYLYATLLSGQYDIPAIYAEVDAVYTTTTPVDAYRGAGRPEATFVVERLVEVAAREMDIDPRRSGGATSSPASRTRPR